MAVITDTIKEIAETRRDGAAAVSEARGTYGSAHKDARDAYRGVPILQKPTWKKSVTAYFYLGGISAGAEVVGALADILGGKKLRRLARTAHVVAFLTLLPCPPLLIEDLGRPSKFHHMLRVFKPLSPMNLGSWTLTTHGVGATLMVARMLAEEGKLPLLGWLVRLLPGAPLAAASLPSALTLGGYTGVLLGTTSTPVWSRSPLLGGLFMASAMSTGAAATSLASAVSGRDNEAAHEVLRTASVGAGAVEMGMLAGYVATSGSAARSLLKFPDVLLTIGGALGTAAGVALEATSSGGSASQRRSRSLAAAAATLVGGALLRYGIMRAGHVSASDREQTLDHMSSTEDRPGWGPRS